MPKGNTGSYKIGRKAGNGELCTIAYAKAHPKTTVIETMSKKKTTK